MPYRASSPQNTQKHPRFLTRLLSLFLHSHSIKITLKDYLRHYCGHQCISQFRILFFSPPPNPSTHIAFPSLHRKKMSSMTTSLEQQLAKVNGVVIPSKLLEAQRPLRAQRGRLQSDDATLDRARDKTCPICGHTDTRPTNIRSHFITCVKTNGNPTGARWDDNFNFVPRPHLVKRKQNDVDER